MDALSQVLLMYGLAILLSLLVAVLIKGIVAVSGRDKPDGGRDRVSLERRTGCDYGLEGEVLMRGDNGATGP